MTDERDRDLRELYRAASKEKPPAALNRHILDAARRSVESPLAKFTPFGGHWPLALSAAAVVVASATLVLYLVDTGDPYLKESEVAGSAIAPRQAPPRAAAEPEAGATADGVSPPPPAPPAAKRERVPRERQAAPASTVKPTAPAASKLSPEDERAVESRRMKDSAMGSFLGGKAAETTNEAVAQPPVPARQSLSERVAEPGVAAEVRDEDGAPEHQLAAIRRLLDTGETEAARRLLQEFVTRYPEHPLPDDLEGLLGGKP